MGFIKKTDSFLGRYKSIVPITKKLAPLFSILFYISLIAAALLVIIAFIVLIVNVDVDKMLLPPHMKAFKEGEEIISYSLKLGNGISVTSDASVITLSHIKVVIYSKIAVYALNLLIVAPVFRLLSALFRNVGNNEVLNEQNAKNINYVGLIILAGNTASTILNNALNYVQVNKFVTGVTEKINYSFSIEWFGIIMGIFIITVGTIYGYACSIQAETNSKAVVYEND